MLWRMFYRLKGEEDTEFTPKFAVCNGVNTTQCEAEIEKGLAKLSWTKRKQFDMDGENKNQTYDIKSKTFDFCNMKAMDLPFNKRVHLPEPLNEDQILRYKT